MIHGFAHQSGGQVRIYSEVGQGTTVCMYLPRHYGDADADDAAPTLTKVPRAEQDETVLIVDDEPSVRMLVTETLEDLGYTAIEAADSAAGLKVLQSNVHIDLLVTDVGLPGGMNGQQMADAGRERRPDLRVLFITGYGENAVLGNGHLEPGMQVLTKPFAMEALAFPHQGSDHVPLGASASCFALDAVPIHGSVARRSVPEEHTVPSVWRCEHERGAADHKGTSST